MSEVQYPQAVVGIIGRGAVVAIRSRGDVSVDVLDAPDGMRPRQPSISGSGLVEVPFAATRRIDKGRIRVRVSEVRSDRTEEVSLPVRIWGPRMSFICLVQSSNVHAGWDPRPMAQYYRRDDGDLVLYEGDEQGDHAWVHARKLERVFHKWAKPVTWLIDGTVAEEQAAQIVAWHRKYCDGVAFLPRSFFYFNKRNYNLTHTCDELAAILRPQAEAFDRAFARAEWPVYTRTMGADQWVGSVGSRFVEAAQAVGFDAIWGIGYDHLTCDTSMYHRGTPWDVYKPKAGNFRVPGANGTFWCLQWTTRDLLNTSYFPPTVGSTTFSTDADDILHNGIPRFQVDYYARLLAEYQRNLSHHDVNVFLVHQEDHDSHIHGSNAVLEAFLDQVHDRETFATMDEVVAWLNARYAPTEHPYQLIEMSDPLTCHAEMQHAAMKGDIPRRFAENRDWGRDGKPNPPHVAYYGPDVLWIFAQGAATPRVFYDYTKSECYPFKEDGEYPAEAVPTLRNVTVQQERLRDALKLTIAFNAEDEATSVPVAAWNEPMNGLREGRLAGTDDQGRECPVWRTRRALVALVRDIVPGKVERQIIVPLEGVAPALPAPR